MLRRGYRLTGTVIPPAPWSSLTVTGVPDGPVAAGEPVTLTVEFSREMTAGETYFGELQLGPPSAPTALSVPIQITRE